MQRYTLANDKHAQKNGHENVLYAAYEGYAQGGLGDYIRSLLCLYVYGKQANLKVVPYISSSHPLRNCLECEQEVAKIKHKVRLTTHDTDVNWIFLELEKMQQLNEDFAVVSNVRFINCEELKPHLKLFRTECLKPKSIIESRIKDLFGQIMSEPLGSKGPERLEGPVDEYVCIHIRCGDKHIVRGGHCDTDVFGYDFEGIILPGIVETLTFFQKHYSNHLVFIISDNENLKLEIKDTFKDTNFHSQIDGKVVCFDTQINHTALEKNVTDEGCVDTVTEFFILSRSKCNVMFGYSGFSIWSSFIYEIPLFQLDKQEMILSPFNYLMHY